MTTAPIIHLIYSTHPSLLQAQETAAALLDRGLVACCNILPGIESHYVWDGKRCRADEVAMLSKTSAERVADAMACIAQQHPHDCPAILHWPLAGGHEAFLQWVAQSVAVADTSADPTANPTAS